MPSPGFFGVFNRNFGTPVRVNILSGSSRVFAIVAIPVFDNGQDARVHGRSHDRDLDTLISYLWIFPAAAVLRHKYPEVRRPYRVPFGEGGIWLATG